MTIKCPICKHKCEMVMVPAKIVSQCVVPSALQKCGPGSASDYQQVVEPRQLSWNCLNEKCDQRKGFPQIRQRDPIFDLPVEQLNLDLDDFNPEEKEKLKDLFKGWEPYARKAAAKATPTQKRIMLNLREYKSLRIDQGNWTFGEKRSVASLIKKEWAKENSGRLTLTPLGNRIIEEFA